MNETELKYFRDSWTPDYSKFKLTGWALLDKIKDDDVVLDIGCGFNLFKQKLGHRLWGIDPANKNADEMISWQNYIPHTDFNVYLALGSINFGDHQNVEFQVAKLAYHCKPGDRVYWRQNPGTADHPWKGVEEVRFFPWTRKHNRDFCKKYSFTLAEIKQDTGDRLYAQWIKN